MLEKSLTLEGQAKQAWKQVVNKYSSKGLTGDSLWNEIINASQRTRQSVNNALGLK
jgi:hypothetical protein